MGRQEHWARFPAAQLGVAPKEELDEAVNNMVNRDYDNLVRNAMNKAKKENPKVTRKDIEAQLKVTKEMILKEKALNSANR